jgi:hypothetical protein
MNAIIYRRGKRDDEAAVPRMLEGEGERNNTTVDRSRLEKGEDHVEEPLLLPRHGLPPSGIVQDGAAAASFLHSFLEASLPTGEWEAALSAIILHKEHNVSHLVAASRVQLRAGMWRQCLRLVQHAEEKGRHSAATGEEPRTAARAIRSLKIIAVHALCQTAAGGQGNAIDQWRVGVQLCHGLTEEARPVDEDDLQHRWKMTTHRRDNKVTMDFERSAAAISQLIAVMPRDAEGARKALSNLRWTLLKLGGGGSGGNGAGGGGRRDERRSNSRGAEQHRRGGASKTTMDTNRSTVDHSPATRRIHRGQHDHLYQQQRMTDHTGVAAPSTDSATHSEATAGVSWKSTTHAVVVDVVHTNMRMTQILRYGSLNHSALARQNRDGWVRALDLYGSIPCPTAVTVSILAKILGNYRREEALLNLFASCPRVTGCSDGGGGGGSISNCGGGSISNCGKAFAEAAFECKSWRAGLAVLQHDLLLPPPAAAAAAASPTLLTTLVPPTCVLTASAATPALIALRQNKAMWHVALAWWWRNGGGGGGRVSSIVPSSSSATATAICGNQKISSYVAQHIAVATHLLMRPPMTPKTSTHMVTHMTWYWQTALEIIASTAHVHEPRAVLFGLQALQLSSCWVKAVALFQDKRDFLDEYGPQELPSIYQVLCDESARRWIPGDVVWMLRRKTWWNPPKKGRWC